MTAAVVRAACLVAVGAALFGAAVPRADALPRRLAAEVTLPAPAPTGVVREFAITAAPAETHLADGTTTRVWAYDGTVPGPTLRVRLGDTVRVRFTNHLPQPTTIHWHGVRVPNAMDGVPHVTQAPVEPGGTFVYEFTPPDAGTFWFHPHVRSSEQVERGLYGVLVVEDRQPAPYAQDVVWVVDDWLLDDAGQVREGFNTMHDLMHDGRWGNVVTVGGRTDTVLAVRAGERLRLRLVNTANGRVFTPDFGSLHADVIAVDGLYLRAPIPAGSFELAPGNRLDVDVTVPPDAVGDLPVIDRFYAARPIPLATIRVAGRAEQPAFASPAHARVPAWGDGMDVPPTQEVRLNARRGGPYGIEWTFNDVAMTGHEHAEPMLALRRGTWNRLRFVNESYRLHPIHLHGMFFRLLARNDQPVDEPFFRDTVLVHGRETVDVGVVPLDPGQWMMHCHVLEHAEAGMMTLIDVTS